MVRRCTIAIVAALLLGALRGLSAGPLGGAAPVAEAAANPPAVIRDPDLFIYVPADAARFQPVQVLVTLHGMDDDGATFCQDLLAAAERNGWIVVSPTFRYQDYKDPALVLQDDTAFLPRLRAMLDDVPARTGLTTRDKVLMYGHSRGAQAVQRFATFYPERVAGVVALAAGSYTLPLAAATVGGRSQALPLPYGVANLRAYTGRDFDADAFRRVAFRVAVGGRDTAVADTPRAWDPYLGQGRVERARAYTTALQEGGVEVTLAIYPDADHNVSPQMRDDALAFLGGIGARNAARYGLGPARGAAAYGAVVNATAPGRR